MRKSLKLNRLLCTKDGRKIGNAIVIDYADKIKILDENGNEKWIGVLIVMTDLGNKVVLTEVEIDELFYIGNLAVSYHKHYVRQKRVVKSNNIIKTKYKPIGIEYDCELTRKIIANLFDSCTCYHHHIKGELIKEKYVLIHHYAHAEYVDRMSHTKNHESYYILVPVSLKLNRQHFNAERDSLLYFKGRINKNWRKVIDYVIRKDETK